MSFKSSAAESLRQGPPAHIAELHDFMDAIQRRSVRPGAYGIAEAIVNIHDAIVESPTSAPDPELREQFSGIASRTERERQAGKAPEYLDVELVWQLTPWIIRNANSRLRSHIDPENRRTHVNIEVGTLAMRNRASIWELIAGFRRRNATKRYLGSILFKDPQSPNR